MSDNKTKTTKTAFSSRSEEASQYKRPEKPKVSIPDKSECTCLIYDIDWTNKAVKEAEFDKRQPNLFDGVAVKFIVLEYVHEDKRVKCLDYSNLEDIKFLKDELYKGSEIDPGEWVRSFITGANYLSVGRVTNAKLSFGNFNKPPTELGLADIYDQSFGLEYGTPYGTFLTPLCNRELTDLTYETFGIQDPKVKEMPIFKVWRRCGVDFDWTDYEGKGNERKLKEGAKKKPYVKWTAYNTEDKVYDLYDLNKSGVNWIPFETSELIRRAIAERDAIVAQERIANKPVSTSSGAIDPNNTPF